MTIGIFGKLCHRVGYLYMVFNVDRYLLFLLEYYPLFIFV